MYFVYFMCTRNAGGTRMCVCVSHRRDIPLFCILNAADGAEGKIE